MCIRSDKDIQLATIKSNINWRWGEVKKVNRSEQQLCYGKPGVEQEDLIQLMIYTQSGLRLWSKETVQLYLHFLSTKETFDQRLFLRFIFDNYHRLKDNGISLVHLKPEDLQQLSKLYIELANHGEDALNQGEVSVKTKKISDPLIKRDYSLKFCGME